MCDAKAFAAADDREFDQIWVRKPGAFKPLCKGDLEEERLVFVCEDDGEGITPEALRRLCHSLALPVNESRHLGLYNVHRRLKLLYGEEYGIRVESENGVRVTVILPCMRPALEEQGDMGT